MGKIYKWGKNPFNDYLFLSMLNNTDISSSEFQGKILSDFIIILRNFIGDNNLSYFDFHIKGNGNSFKLVANNIVTALWLSGVYPKDSDTVFHSNTCIYNQMEFKFNKRTKKLSVKSLEK